MTTPTPHLFTPHNHPHTHTHTRQHTHTQLRTIYTVPLQQLLAAAILERPHTTGAVGTHSHTSQALAINGHSNDPVCVCVCVCGVCVCGVVY